MPLGCTSKAEDSRYYLHEAVDENGNLLYAKDEGSMLPPTGPQISPQSTVANTEPSVNSISQVGGNSQGAVSAIERMAATVGSEGAKVLREFYTEAEGDEISYIERVLPLYNAGKAGKIVNVDALSRVEQAMYNAGVIDAKVEKAKIVANDAKIEYNNTYTEADNGRKVYLRDGGERTDGENTGESVRVVEEGTGRNQSGQTKGKSRDSEAASLTLGKEVSTASFYIPGGSTTDKICRIAGGETTAMKNARAKASKRGLNVVFFAGGYLTVDGAPARGYISGKNVLIRADDPDFTADQIMEHEIGHDKIAKGEIDLDTVKDRLNSIYGEESVDFICQQYVEAYEGSNLAPDKVFEEMVCDSLGDMNAFDSESEIREAADGFLASTKAVTEASTRAATSPDAVVEGKASTAREAKSTETYFKSVFSKVSIDKIRSEVRGNIKSQYSQFRSEFLKYFDSDSVESAWVFVSTVYYGRTYAYVFPLRDADFRDITGYKVPQKYQRNIHNLTLKHLKEIRSNAISKNDESIHGPTGKSNNKISGNDYSGYDTNDNNGDFENRRNNGSIPSSSKYIGAFSGNESDQGGNGGDYVVSSDGTQDLKQLTVTLWNYFKENSPDTTTYLLMKKIAQEAGIDTEASSNEAVFSVDKNTDKNGAKGHSSHVLPSDRTSKPLTVEQKEIWKRVQKMTPMQIANMQLEDIDPLPKREPRKPSGVNAENGKESKFYGSAMRSDNVFAETRDLIESMDDVRYYYGISNEETLNEANDRLNLKGQTENNRFFALNPESATAVDVAEGFILLKRYQDKGDFETAAI